MHTSAAPEVSIIIVSYNTRALTLACLDSVLAETRGVAYELIVVDNASADGSADAIATHPSRPRLIRLDENIGFARANNLAAREACGTYLVLLNPDTVILDRAIDRLYGFASARPDALIWGGRTLFADGRLNPSSCWRRMTMWNLACRALGLTGLLPRSTLFNGEAYGGWARDTERPVDIVSGCFLMIPRELWRRLGGFDPTFFMYGEEADLCLRARRLGARPRVTPLATIIHHGGASERTRSAKMAKLLAAKATLIRRHWHPALAPAGLALQAAWPLSRWLATSMIAAATRSAARDADAQAWRAIWRLRSTWLKGYPARREPAPSTAAAIA